MNTIICSNCSAVIEIDKALEGQIEARVLSAERHKHQEELARITAEQETALIKERTRATELADKQLAGERELLSNQAEADLAHEKKKIMQEAANEQRKVLAAQESLMKQLKDDAAAERTASHTLREQLTELTKALREERSAKENAELEAQKHLAAEESNIREEATKLADERQRLNIAAKEKQLQDALKVNEELQRKLQQGSQQLQGEIMELDFERALSDAFRDDSITPVAKGVNGADIAQTVLNSHGATCGTILWEIKRTKNWTDSWIPKLKADLRSAKANIPVIITEVMPKLLEDDMGQIEGVWICKPKLAIPLGMLLRQGLLDVMTQKALAQNQGSKAESLYGFITSHEFIQQVESMVETYQEMTLQIQKERVAYERMWAQRDKQAQKLFMGTANIIGGMQGHIGQASMPKIKGLDLLESGDDEPLI
jgi:hypothetical protein